MTEESGLRDLAGHFVAQKQNLLSDPQGRKEPALPQFMSWHTWWKAQQKQRLGSSHCKESRGEREGTRGSFFLLFLHLLIQPFPRTSLYVQVSVLMSASGPG